MQSILAGRVRCMYCGASGPFWECNCVCAQEIRDGKRQKPKIAINRKGVPLTYAYDPDIHFLPPDGRMLGPGEGAIVTPETPKSVILPAKSVTETPESVILTPDARKRAAAALRQKRWRDRRK